MTEEQKLRYKRAFNDALRGAPPAQADETYIDGYAEGTRERIKNMLPREDAAQLS